MNDFQEYFDMLMVLGEYREHYRNAQDLYATRNRIGNKNHTWLLSD